MFELDFVRANIIYENSDVFGIFSIKLKIYKTKNSKQVQKNIRKVFVYGIELTPILIFRYPAIYV